MQRFLCVLILISFTLGINGCAAAGTSSNDALAGIYVMTLTRDQIFAAGGNSILAAMATGQLQLELTKDGTSRISTHNDLGWSSREEGPYRVSGDALIFEPQTGTRACLEGVTGTYRWRLDGEKLFLTLISDECERRFILPAAPWLRQP